MQKQSQLGEECNIPFSIENGAFEQTQEMNNFLNKSPSVAIIIPVYNRRDDVLNIIRQLHQINYENHTIVVVDDGSTDGTSEEIRRLFDDVVLLQGDGTLWWAGATNLGVKWALENNFDYILTLNDDQIVDKNFLRFLVDAAKKDPLTIAGSFVYYKHNPERIFSGGIVLKGLSRKPIQVAADRVVWHLEKPVEVDILPGFSVLLPAGVFRNVGFYNEQRLPQYYSDGELTIRAKRSGYRLITVPTSKVWNDRMNKPHEQILGFRKFSWLLLSKKSAFNIRAYFYFRTIIFGSRWKFLLFGLPHIVSYIRRLLTRSFIPINIRHYAKQVFKSNGDK